jgi:hypothetical protein
MIDSCWNGWLIFTEVFFGDYWRIKTGGWEERRKVQRKCHYACKIDPNWNMRMEMENQRRDHRLLTPIKCQKSKMKRKVRGEER